MTLLREGVDTAVIALWLGHAGIRSTSARARRHDHQSTGARPWHPAVRPARPLDVLAAAGFPGKRDELATACGRDGFALLAAAYDRSAPGWPRELPALDALAGEGVDRRALHACPLDIP